MTPYSPELHALIGSVCIFTQPNGPDILAKLAGIDPEPDESADIDAWSTERNLTLSDPFEILRSPQGLVPVPWLLYANPSSEIVENEKTHRLFVIPKEHFKLVFTAHPNLAAGHEVLFAPQENVVAGPSKRIVVPGDLRLTPSEPKGAGF